MSDDGEPLFGDFAIGCRGRKYVLEAHTAPQLVELLKRALADRERGLGEHRIEASEQLLFRIASYANGDARAAYNTLELCVRSAKARADGTFAITAELLDDVSQRRMLRYDKSGEEHFNLISALHKSVRNSDPDAALYWLARMLESGEDPLYLARRMVRMASEDIGLAEPGALAVTLSAKEAFDFLGAPEGNLALAQDAVYLFWRRSRMHSIRLMARCRKMCRRRKRIRTAAFAQRGDGLNEKY